MNTMQIIQGVIRDLQSVVDTDEQELYDIIPEYERYKRIKRKYQMHEISDDAVINSIQLVCKELYEFIQILYCNTDMRKERIQIESVLRTLYDKFVTEKN